MVSIRQSAAACGVLAPLVAFAGIGLAVLLAPPEAFSPATGALSDLGVAAGSAPFFNGGLLLAGVLGVVFAGWLWTAASDPLQRGGAATFGAAMVAMAGVGLFPLGTAYHGPAAVAFYVLFTYSLFLHGSGTVRVGEIKRGLTSIWIALAHQTAWLLWLVAGDPVGVPGLAVPETTGAMLLAYWTITRARR